MTGQVFDIEHSSLVDGPGIRTAVFFKGCNLRCTWCHNPESQQIQSELLFYRDRCTHCGSCLCAKEACDLCGACALHCPSGAKKLSGRTVTVEEVLEEILLDAPFYGNDGGVTFTGGECMLQIDFLTALLAQCKAHGIHTAVDTAGNVPWDYFLKILPYTDLILYDIKHMDSALHQAYTGAGNRLILENFKKLLKVARVWVRIPIIGNVNDSKENFKAVADFFELHGKPEQIDLLPYHAMGEKKYSALGRSFQSFLVPSQEQIRELRHLIDHR